MNEKPESWLRFILTVIFFPLVLLILGSYFIPRMIDSSNKTQAIREARLKRAIDIGDRNKDFDSRLNVLKTRMDTFNQQNVRGRFSLAEVRKLQKEFQQKYTDDYLELDRIAWWWYWGLEREARIFDLLSSQEVTALHDLLEQYGKNVAGSIGALSPLWQVLSSSEYSVSKSGQKRIQALESGMNANLQRLSNDRTQLIQNIAAIFAQTKHEPEH